MSIAGPADMTLYEVNASADVIASRCAADANIIFGAVVDDSLGDEIRVTVVAAGFDGGRRPFQMEGPGMGVDSGDDQLIPSFVRG